MCAKMYSYASRSRASSATRQNQDMSLKVYLALEGSDAVAELISEALLGDALTEGRSVVDDLGVANAVVSSTRDIDRLPESLPDGVGLLQLVDCGAGGRFGEAAGLMVANVSAVLADRAALWATSQVGVARDALAASGLDRPIHVGVIGIGALGARIVRGLQGDRDEVIESVVVADIRTPRQGLLHELGVRRSTLDLLLSTSDVVVVAVHRGPTSSPLLGSRELRLVGNHVWVVNVSGDGVVEDSGAVGVKVVERPMSELSRDVEVHGREVAGAVVDNLRRYSAGDAPVGLVEHVTYPSAGDPAFWSSRMSPVRGLD